MSRLPIICFFVLLWNVPQTENASTDDLVAYEGYIGVYDGFSLLLLR